MNTKLISLVIVILIAVSGVFVFRKGEVKKESMNVDADSAINTDNSNDPYVQPKSVTESKPDESVKVETKASAPVKNDTPIVSNTNYYVGGIVITSFKPNDLIKLPLNVEGYSNGSGWAANEGEVGNVEVFDANGKSISNVAVLRSITDWMKYPVYFKASVGDREMMSYIKTDTGTVRFSTNEQKDGKSLKTVSIPVRFK